MKFVLAACKQTNYNDVGLVPCSLSGVMIPSLMSDAVTMEHVIASASSTLISPNDSASCSRPITTCFRRFSWIENKKHL